MSKIWEWIKNNPNRAMFLVPILLVAGISISHVVAWYNIANPINWAIYLSIAIEVGAMTALVAATNKIKGGVWFMFGVVTFIQMVGNIFFCFKEIDSNGQLFKSWVELTGPVWDMLGSDVTDVIAMKRWLAFLEGGLLPVISLTSLHFFIKYEDNKHIIVDEIKKENIFEKEEENEVKEENIFQDDVEETSIKENMETYIIEPTDETFLEETKEEEQILIETSKTPQNASEMMLTTNEDIINSIPSDEEVSDMDLKEELYQPPTKSVPTPQPEKKRLMYIKPI